MVVRYRKVAALALALGLVSCDAPTIPEETYAYDPRLPGGFIFHWPIGSTISVFADPAGWPENIDHLAAVRDAFASWEEVIYYRDYALRVVHDPANADVIIHHRDAPFLVDLRECSYPDASASGVTFFCPSPSFDSLQVLPLLSGAPGRVKMDVSVGDPMHVSQGNVQALVAHELGHVLGIGAHSPESRDLMFAGDLRRSTPSERDAWTLRWVLRQPPDIRP